MTQDTEVTIRRAREDEAAMIASLTVDAYAEHAAAMSPDAWSTYAQEIATVRGRMEDGVVLVAERDDAVVGTITLFLDWRGAQEGAAAVRMLAVPPPHRGTGVGRALMERAVGIAREAGKKRIIMTAVPSMEAVRDMTARMGFERAPTLDHEPAPGVRVEGYALDL